MGSHGGGGTSMNILVLINCKSQNASLTLWKRRALLIEIGHFPLKLLTQFDPVSAEIPKQGFIMSQDLFHVTYTN
jgi:hypothetical protein